MRKFFLAGVAAGVLALGACSTSSTGTTTVTLSAAQAEASVILTALNDGAAIYTGAASTTPAQAAAAKNVLAIATTAVDAFTGNVSVESPAQLAETVSQDLAAVLSVLPIDPVTKTAIDAGLAIIDGFVAGTFSQPAPASLALAAPERVAPPVPIPAPHRLP